MKKNLNNHSNITTPLSDYVENYVSSSPVRLHMPGHKGDGLLGIENMDITELTEDAYLYGCQGPVLESMKNASSLFKSGMTYYSAEGSSLAIKAMLATILLEYRSVHSPDANRPFILAARNVHRSFIDACVLLDLDVRFVTPNTDTNSGVSLETDTTSAYDSSNHHTKSGKFHICTNNISAVDIETALRNCTDSESPSRQIEKTDSGSDNHISNDSGLIGVYITSPDYLGNIMDVSGISNVCHKYNLPLLVDNAHGAYLAFTTPVQHPIQLGATMCADSAHKTLPVLTGGAYLHLSKNYTERFDKFVPKALQLFATTSPSFLISCSLDKCNRYLYDGYRDKLAECIETIRLLKEKMLANNIAVQESEPLKIVINTAVNGYTGYEISKELSCKYSIFCEYADSEYIVFMLTPSNKKFDFDRILTWINDTILHDINVDFMSPFENDFEMINATFSMTIRDAFFADYIMVSPDEALGHICAHAVISCPPAIPIAVCGEIINSDMVKAFIRYGITKVAVVCK